MSRDLGKRDEREKRMDLYIGGRAQGKLSYVLGKYENPIVLDEQNFKIDLKDKRIVLMREEDFIKQDAFPEEERQKTQAAFPVEIESGKSDGLVWNHFHLAVKAFLAGGMEQEEIWKWMQEFLEENPRMAIISDEIGSGIVPMDREERIYRETTGRLLQRIAKKADKVERIFCGIPQKLK